MTNLEFKYLNIVINIELPFSDSVRELACRVAHENKLRPYEEDDLTNALSEFINFENQNLLDTLANESLSNTLKDSNDEDMIRHWEKQFKEETVAYGDKSGSSDSELFSAAYHKLVHSGEALSTMLEHEQSYVLEVLKMIQQRDDQINKLTQRQADDMLKMKEDFEQNKASSDEINNLNRTHLDQQSLLLVKWMSKIETLKETQRREYREWVMKLLEDHQRTITLQSSFSSPNSPDEIKPFPLMNSILNDSNNVDVSSLEESFTIHLGSQMKQIYNVRIQSANILDLCSIPYGSNNNEQQVQRIQTALALYTNDLCGTVLPCDSIVDESGLTRKFVTEASKSTDFHVDNVEKQLEIVNYLTKEMSDSSSSNCKGKKKSLVSGDVFITKHSNLSLTHIVFHMIVDESLYSGEMNSRHNIILAIRNIMKVCCSYDITTLTIPLLLSHEMTEDMTVVWCTKRAELVYKCVKGFMIEMTSWGGSELKNLQFVVPKGISEEVFSSLANMLPSIFRVSNPLVFKAK